jgi:hypothetical protein
MHDHVVPNALLRGPRHWHLRIYKALTQLLEPSDGRPSLPYTNICTVLGMVMIPEELERFAWRFGVLRSTVMHMANPVDQPDRWRREWAEVKELVAEIDRLHAELPSGT